jgi:hypothetical protein
MNRPTVAAAVGLLTLAGAELAYVALAGYLVWITHDAAHLKAANPNGVVVGATAALATAFGAGYAALLGIPTEKARAATPAGIGRVLTWLSSSKTLNNVLAVGVFLYMVASAALGLVFVIRQEESPGIVKTVAVGFGGYAIAYVGRAFSDWSA